MLLLVTPFQSYIIDEHLNILDLKFSKLPKCNFTLRCPLPSFLVNFTMKTGQTSEF